jgi:ribosome-binding protein aMBF1 (putative translation factor)
MIEIVKSKYPNVKKLLLAGANGKEIAAVYPGISPSLITVQRKKLGLKARRGHPIGPRDAEKLAAIKILYSKGISMSEIADVYGVSRQRIDQIVNPLKESARKRSGILQRKEACERCGSNSAIERHHPDYNKPLHIQWLCRACHGFAHGNWIAKTRTRQWMAQIRSGKQLIQKQRTEARLQDNINHRLLIGHCLKTFRRKSGIKLNDVAMKMGEWPQILCALERGKTRARRWWTPKKIEAYVAAVKSLRKVVDNRA